MSCPNCEIDLACPCQNCVGHRKKRGEFKALLWEWIDGETMRCPICLFTADANFWEEYDFYIYDKERGKLSEREEKYFNKNLVFWKQKNKTLNRG